MDGGPFGQSLVKQNDGGEQQAGGYAGLSQGGANGAGRSGKGYAILGHLHPLVPGPSPALALPRPRAPLPLPDFTP